jgi:PAS domain S-box-containing protein
MTSSTSPPERAARHAVILVDDAGCVVSWNAAASRLDGYGAVEVTGKPFDIFFTEDDRADGKARALLTLARAEGEAETTHRRVRKDGSRYSAHVRLSAVTDDRAEEASTRGAPRFAALVRDLTGERGAAEEELRMLEERFRLLVSHVVDYAIYMLDEEGHVTTWNPGAERMTGYSESEVLGTDFARFFPEEDVHSGKPGRELARARQSGRYEDEGWRVRKDGTRFWANAILTALHGPTGELVGFAKITRDLTARRDAEDVARALVREQATREIAEASEARLRRKEEEYRSLSQRLEVVLEGVADGITVQDRTGHIVYANSAAARICGFASGTEMMAATPAEILDRFDILGEDGAPFPVEALPGRRALAGEAAASALLRVREKRSRRQWWSIVRSTAVLSSDGSTELAVNIWHDVTAARRQEQSARYLAEATAALSRSLEQAEMLRTFAALLVPELADWCTVHLREGDALIPYTTVHIDPAKVEMAREYQRRYSPDPLAPRGLWNVVRTGAVEVYNDITDEVLVATTKDPERLAVLRAMGMTAVAIAPIRATDRILGAITIAAAESNRRFDGVDVALLEELGRRAGVALENAQLYADAQRAARIAEEASRAKDAFLATVSHELRTPLTAILGWSSMLTASVHDPAFARPLQVIHRNAEAQVRIVDDLLDVSRIVTGKFTLERQPTDLVVIARETIESVRPTADAKGIPLVFTTERDALPLIADPVRLQQVIWNLLSNAVKFTPPGGRVTVSLHTAEDAAVLRVTDTGEGVAPELLDVIFERFHQVDAGFNRRFGGLGLGLSLVRHIAQLHGGRATASSEGRGRGATFEVSLPVTRPLPAETGDRVHSGSRGASRKLPLAGVRVLVVDDDRDTREIVATAVLERGGIVHSAASATDGLSALESFHAHVLVSDIGMPGDDGFAFIRRVRALPPDRGGRTPAIALTAYTRSEDRAATLLAGFTMHLGKPVELEQLISALARLAAEGHG